MDALKVDDDLGEAPDILFGDGATVVGGGAGELADHETPDCSLAVEEPGFLGLDAEAYTMPSQLFKVEPDQVTLMLPSEFDGKARGDQVGQVSGIAAAM